MLELVFHTSRQIAIVCQNYSCELSEIAASHSDIFFETHGNWYMLLLRLTAIVCQNYSCQLSKLLSSLGIAKTIASSAILDL
jgi:hypothetical protein